MAKRTKRRAKRPGPTRPSIVTPRAPAAAAPTAWPLASGLPPVIWRGLIFDPSGYASELRHFTRAWEAAGLQVRLEELARAKADAGVAEQERARLERLLAVQLPANTPYLKVWHFFPRFYERDPNALATIARTMYETDRLPEEWINGTQLMDRLWVPSEFNLETFSRSGVPADKLRVLPPCIDLAQYGPHVPAVDLQSGRSFTFLSIFEWSPRKAWDVMIRAFVEEFHPDDDVALMLYVPSSLGKTQQQIANDIFEVVRSAVGQRKTAPIVLRAVIVHDDILPSLYRGAQAYLGLSRGEGWGRPMMEAMACGLPTIATGWSANTAFMNDRNSYLAEYDVVDVPESALDQLESYAGHRWAEPSLEHTRTLMRQVFDNRQESQERGAIAARDIAEHYNPTVIGQRLAELCREAADLHGPRPTQGFTFTNTPATTAPTATGAVPVIWEGVFFETHSLGLVNRELGLALLRANAIQLQIRQRELEPIKFDPREDARLAPLLEAVDRPLPVPPSAYIRHAWPPIFDRPPAGKWVMIQPWEFGSLPVEWVAPMRDLVDEVWAYSGIVRQMYAESGVPAEKVHVVPLGIDPALFRPDVQGIELPGAKSFRFLFVGGTIGRKGIDVLLSAYRRAFNNHDDVTLLVKDMGQDSFYKGQNAAQAIAQLQADPSAPHILYATGTLTDSQMASLYTGCHCLVHPYRGEGFGLPVAEAMACGLPVIVTQGGSTDDFCAEDRAYFIPSTRRAISLPYQTAGQPWMLEPDVEALAAEMRRVYESPGTAAAKGLAGSVWTRANLTWDASARVAAERLRALAAAHTPSRAERRLAAARGR